MTGDVINPIGHPFVGTPMEPGRKGAQTATILTAARELWPPDGTPPEAISVAQRNQSIWRWYARRRVGGRPILPSDRHLRRVFNGR
jgi:hypothetical protein